MNREREYTQFVRDKEKRMYRGLDKGKREDLHIGMCAKHGNPLKKNRAVNIWHSQTDEVITILSAIR